MIFEVESADIPMFSIVTVGRDPWLYTSHVYNYF